LVKGHPERIKGSVYVCFVICALLLAGLWLFTRGKPRSLSLVRFFEIAPVFEARPGQPLQENWTLGLVWGGATGGDGVGGYLL